MQILTYSCVDLEFYKPASHASHASHASPSTNVKIFYLLHLYSDENKNKSNGTRLIRSQC